MEDEKDAGRWGFLGKRVLGVREQHVQGHSCALDTAKSLLWLKPKSIKRQGPRTESPGDGVKGLRCYPEDNLGAIGRMSIANRHLGLVLGTPALVTVWRAG